MQLWARERGWRIQAASDIFLKKLGTGLPIDIYLRQDDNGNYPLPNSLPKGKLSRAGTTQAIFFPASLPAFDPDNADEYAQEYLRYLLSDGHKAQLSQCDPIRLEGLIVGADGEPHHLTFYQVLHDGNDTVDYLVAVLHDDCANGNGAGVGHPNR
jgi:hypothetical protein